MLTYNLNLSGQNLLGADKFSVAAESNESVRFNFYFDRSWRCFDTKAAVFRDSARNYYVMEILGGGVTIPWEVLRTDDGFDLAVVAYDEAVVYTSKRVRIEVSSSLLPEFCRQLSPTETLFDRFKAECKNQALLEYRDELRAMKKSYEDRLYEKENEIIAEQKNTAAVAAEKDEIIAQLNYDAECERVRYGSRITQLATELEAQKEKAHNWDLIDTAVSQKTSILFPLWNGGTEPFELPMLNTHRFTGIFNNYISTYLTKAGFDVSSVTALNNAFQSKNIQEITLRNSDNIKNLNYIFADCKSLVYADIGNIKLCTNFVAAFSGCTALKKVKLGNAERLADIRSAFSECIALEEIDGILSLILVSNTTENMFNNCISLHTVRFAEKTIRVSLDMGKCINLSKDSLYSLANGLSDEIADTVKISSTAFNDNLTDDEKAEIQNIISEKSWTLVLS